MGVSIGRGVRGCVTPSQCLRTLVLSGDFISARCHYELAITGVASFNNLMEIPSNPAAFLSEKFLEEAFSSTNLRMETESTALLFEKCLIVNVAVWIR